MNLSDGTKRAADTVALVAAGAAPVASLTLGQQIVLVISGIAGALSILWYLTRFYEWLRNSE
jgi:hypothetical protein